MHPDDRAKAGVLRVGGLPLVALGLAARATGALDPGGLSGRSPRAGLTARGERPGLLAAAVGGLIAGVAAIVAARRVAEAGFGGAAFRQHLRGTKVVSSRWLTWTTRQRGHQQITVAGVPMPSAV